MISTLIDDIISRLGNSHLNTESNGTNKAESTTGKTMEASRLKALLYSALEKANVVSRDEFDAQTAILMRTRKRIQQLENQVFIMEQALLKEE